MKHIRSPEHKTVFSHLMAQQRTSTPSSCEVRYENVHDSMYIIMVSLLIHSYDKLVCNRIRMCPNTHYKSFTVNTAEHTNNVNGAPAIVT